MTASASPTAPRPPSGPREGEREMRWQCPHCRSKGPAYFTRSGVELMRCPSCSRGYLLIVGDLRECGAFPEEVRFHATGKDPGTVGHPSEPLVPRRQPPAPYRRKRDAEFDALRGELAEALGALDGQGRRFAGKWAVDPQWVLWAISVALLAWAFYAAVTR